MKATLKRSNLYTVKVGDIEYYSFKIIGTMAGMVHLKNSEGIIVLNYERETGLSKIFTSIIDPEDFPDEIFEDCAVVKCSECFLKKDGE